VTCWLAAGVLWSELGLGSPTVGAAGDLAGLSAPLVERLFSSCPVRGGGDEGNLGKRTGRPRYPFTPPSLIPSTNVRWERKKRVLTGRLMTTDMAVMRRLCRLLARCARGISPCPVRESVTRLVAMP